MPNTLINARFISPGGKASTLIHAVVSSSDRGSVFPLCDELPLRFVSSRSAGCKSLTVAVWTALEAPGPDPVHNNEGPVGPCNDWLASHQREDQPKDDCDVVDVSTDFNDLYWYLMMFHLNTSSLLCCIYVSFRRQFYKKKDFMTEEIHPSSII